MHVVAPVLDILDDDLVRRMYGEGARRADGEAVIDAPGVLDVLLAVLGLGAVEHGGVHYEPDGLVLIGEPIGSEALDRLIKVLLRVEHRVSPSLYLPSCEKGYPSDNI